MRIKEEDVTPTHIKLKDGRLFTASPLLDRARESYKETRSTYSLNKSTRKMVASAQFGNQRGRPPKYSYDDSVWMQDKSPQEIANKFNLTRSKANAIKHYVRKFWNLR